MLLVQISCGYKHCMALTNRELIIISHKKLCTKQYYNQYSLPEYFNKISDVTNCSIFEPNRTRGV